MRLHEFILYLGEHPHRWLAAQSDPGSMLEEAGLHPDDVAALTSGDVSQVIQAIHHSLANQETAPATADAARPPRGAGSLIVVGTGMCAGSQLVSSARSAMAERADETS